MKILAIETSAVTASVAVTQEETLLAQSFQNTGLTHSATLMPMAADLLKNTGLTLEETAQTLNIPRTTVSTRQKRALALLRVELDDKEVSS